MANRTLLMAVMVGTLTLPALLRGGDPPAAEGENTPDTQGPAAPQQAESMTDSTENGPAKPTPAEQDRAALELGRRVLAVGRAIGDPQSPGAMRAVTDLGHDQRYYVMVRGWLSYQLQADQSLVEAHRGKAPEPITQRVEFLRRAIRAVDLE
jgi:hypothetical protein